MMKHWKKAAVVVICLVFAGAVITGCSAKDSDFQQKYYTAESLTVRNIEIDVTDRKILLSPSPDDRVHIRYYESEKEYYSIDLLEENTLKISCKTNKEWLDYIGSKPDVLYHTVELMIPDGMLSSLKITTTNEDLLLPALEADDISVSVNEGDIEFEMLSVGKTLHLEAKNGDIRGTVVGGYDDFSISAEVKKGECNLPKYKDGGSKILTVSANNGNVEIELEKVAQS